MFKVSCFYQKVHNFLLCRPTSNLYAKYFPGESYDAHTAIGDVDAMIKLFTRTPFVQYDC